ncbi:Mandelonitrile lyase, related, putative isoform 3 [Capsicum annuum]|nr:Mandelonitrile lyase, related, putative isoform 3 [Capsicum annuum]
MRPFSFSPTMEGTSIARDGGGSTSSRSDSSDCDSITNASGSLDLTEASESFQSDLLSKPCNPSDGFRCGFCERFLSQRSPWSVRRIVRSGDMPVVGVLSCRHVFHAKCLEQATPKSCKSDPTCPICAKLGEGSSPEQRVLSKFFPRLKTSSEEGPPKPWGCAHSGDCIGGALHTPSRGTMLALNKSRIRKNLSLKDLNKYISPPFLAMKKEAQDEFTKQRIKKMTEELQKLRAENRLKEITIKMHEVLNEKEEVTVDMNPDDLKDLIYVMKENLKRIQEAMKKKVDNEGFASNVS